MYRNDRDCGDMQKARGQVNRMSDLISRQAAIDALNGNMGEQKEALDMAIKALEEPERKKGEWLELTNTNHTYVCSVCGRMLVNITDGKNKVTKNYPFCHCGADMRGEQDEKK